jgi:hypothetical protein
MVDSKHDGKLPGGYSVEQAEKELSDTFQELLYTCVNELGFNPNEGAEKTKSTPDKPFGEDGRWQEELSCEVTVRYVRRYNVDDRGTPSLQSVALLGARSCAEELDEAFAGGGASYPREGGTIQAFGSGKVYEVTLRARLERDFKQEPSEPPIFPLI